MSEKIRKKRIAILMIGLIAAVAAAAVFHVVPKGIESMNVYVDGKPVGERIELSEGDKMSLTCEIEPEIFEDRHVEYLVSDPEVLSVGKDGRVTALSEGETIVTAEAAGFDKEISFKVVEADPGVKDIEGLDDDMFMHAGSSIVLYPELVMESDDLEEPPIEYRSGDEKVVRVLEDGGVVAVGPGETTITVKAGRVTKKIEVIIAENADNSTDDSITTDNSGDDNTNGA